MLDGIPLTELGADDVVAAVTVGVITVAGVALTADQGADSPETRSRCS